MESSWPMVRPVVAKPIPSLEASLPLTRCWNRKAAPMLDWITHCIIRVALFPDVSITYLNTSRTTPANSSESQCPSWKFIWNKLLIFYSSQPTLNLHSTVLLTQMATDLNQCLQSDKGAVKLHLAVTKVGLICSSEKIQRQEYLCMVSAKYRSSMLRCCINSSSMEWRGGKQIQLAWIRTLQDPMLSCRF